MKKIKVLNLYSGIGGNRKLWPNDEIEVTAIEYNGEIAKIYQDFFPNDKVIVTDAHQYLLEHYEEFDFIWASPPCPSHSILNRTGRFKQVRYPDMKLYQEIILLKFNFKGLWVIENVKPYYEAFQINNYKPQESGRHYYWCNFNITNKNIRSPKALTDMTKKELMVWHDLYFEKNVYIKPNHCERQILRNCVHPKLGLHVWNCAFKEKQKTLV